MRRWVALRLLSTALSAATRAQSTTSFTPTRDVQMVQTLSEADGADEAGGDWGADGAGGDWGADGADGAGGDWGASGADGAGGDWGASGAGGDWGASGADGAGGDWGASGADGAGGDWGASGGSVFELSPADAAALPRTPPRPAAGPSPLSAAERQRLAAMIRDAHCGGLDDRAARYQSGLELRWIEEWAHDEGLRTGKSHDDIRRAIKRAVLERAELHKPLAYIIGTQPFYGCDIRCAPPLLCPRPETEMWTYWFVRCHLSHASSPLRVLDMCSGTGCIGVAIAKHVPRAHIVALDVAEDAVRMSEENARRNGIEPARYRALQSDMFEFFLEPGADGARRPLAAAHAASFDAVVANPPYVLPDEYEGLAPGVRLWESRVALVGDARREARQYLYFQELCEMGAAVLKPKAQRDPALVGRPNIVIEVGIQGERVASLMERSGLWESVEVHMDHAQQLRWISASSTH